MDKVSSFTTPGGEEMVILPRADYDRLVARDARDDPDLRAARKTLARIRAGAESTIPLAVVKMTSLDGLSPLRAWRLHRKLSIPTLARNAGKSASYVTQLENGTRAGSVATMTRLATALGITLDLLVA